MPSSGTPPSQREHSRGSPRRLAVSLAIAPIAAIGWVSLASLDLVTRLACFRKHPSQGLLSLIWGFSFGVLLWAGGLALGLGLARATLFAFIAAGSIALFVYLRGAAREGPPVEQPSALRRRLLTRWRASH